MSPATAWTELQITATAWQEGVPIAGDNPDDFFIDVLFEGTLFFNPGTTYTELSIGATSGTELSITATPWTELT